MASRSTCHSGRFRACRSRRSFFVRQVYFFFQRWKLRTGSTAAGPRSPSLPARPMPRRMGHTRCRGRGWAQAERVSRPRHRGGVGLGWARLCSAAFGWARLCSARFDYVRLGSAMLSWAGLGSARFVPAQLGKARLGPVTGGAVPGAFRRLWEGEEVAQELKENHITKKK